MNIAELGVKIDSADAIQAKTSLDEMAKAGGRAEQSAVSLMNEMQALEKSLSTGAKTTQDLAKQRDALAKLTKTGAYGEAEFTKITAQLDKQQVALAKSTMDEQKALNSLLGAIDPARAAVAKLDKQVEDLGKHLDAGRISQDQYNASLGKIDKDYAKLEKTATGFDKLKLGSRQAQENVVQLGNALSSGDWGSGVRAVAQLGAGAGASAAGLLAILAPIALATAAVGALGVAFYKGGKEQDDFNKSLTLTGNYAGVSAGQLGDMARQVSATIGTTGAAADVLASLAGSGKIAGESFVGIAQAAISMQEATGKAVGDTVAEFKKLADDPVKASAALNEQYHYLTASVYSQIAALEEQGDHAGAVKLATEQYADAINERTPKILENLSFWEKGYNAVARAADQLKNIGRAPTNTDRIQTAREVLERLETRGGSERIPGEDPVYIGEKGKQSLRDYIRGLEVKAAAEEADAKALADQTKAQLASQQAMIKVDALTKSAWTNEQKRNEALKEYRKQLDDIRITDPKDSRLDQSAIDKNISNINARFKDPKGAAGSVDLTGFNSAKNILAETLAYYKNSDKELEASQRAGVISQASYTEQRVSLLKQQAEEVAQGYQSEIAALEAAKTKKGTTAAQLIQIDQKVADARSAMVKAQQDSDSELAIIATNEEGRLRKQTLAVNTYTSALQQQVDTLRQQGIRAASGLGQGDRERGLTDQQNGIDDRFNQQRLELANQYGDGSRGMSLDEYTQKLNALKATQQDLHDTVQANYDDMTAAQGSWSAGASSAWQNYLESARDVAGQTKSLFTNAFSSMEDAIVNFAMTGKLSFADFTKSILADMARIAVRQASSQAMSALFGLAASAAGSYFGGGATSAGSTQAGYSGDLSGFSPGSVQAKGGAWSGGVQMFANGGAFTNSIVSKPTAFGMAGGKTGVMGEAGEEAIMPLTRTSSGKLGVMAMGAGAGATQINVEVHIDGDGNASSSADAPGYDLFGKELATFVEQKYQELRSRDMRQGGVINNAIKGR